jgi:16S rRNA (cytosine967-C5)-methyltransferase
VSAALPLAQLLDHTADAVHAVRLRGRSLTDALAAVPPVARAGTQALAFHVMRWLGSAIAARALLAAKAPPPAVESLLVSAIALLWPTGDVPPYAPHTLVDQAVAAARRRTPAASGFINAVLRRFVRERERIVAAAIRDPQGAFNHPPWWIERVRRDWPVAWQALLAADQHHPPMTLRVNARRGDAAGYVARLAAHGIAAEAIAAHAVRLAAPLPVHALPGFADGAVSVQDASAQRAAPLLLGSAMPRGARVLDACAAPGGKAAHLLELADIDLLALDADPLRLQHVQQTLNRLSLTARLAAADARDTASWWDGRPFDAILLDAPCSGSGVVRRHPDIRWLRRPGDIAALATTQRELLDALWPLLKPGGRLLYATCSVFRAEGHEAIDAFLQRSGGAAPRLDPASPGHLLPLADNRNEGARPSSGAAAGDGFFYALLHKP